MLNKELDTFYSLLKQINSPSAGTKEESFIEKYIQFIRSQNEETYKIMLAPVMSFLYSNLVFWNDKLPFKQKSFTFSSKNFGSPSIPEISISEYLDRIIKYTQCSAECYIISLIYLDRIISSKNFLITSNNIHRLMIISIMIASKLFDDNPYNNRYYSLVGGISTKELNLFELQFLNLINYNLNITLDIFQTYRYYIELNIIQSLQDTNSKISKQITSFCSIEEKNNQNIQNNNKKEYCKTIYKYSSEVKENEKILAKSLRRSSSFNQTSSGSSDSRKIFNWRKRRSSSFNILLVSQG